jgi:hypothetical protein
LTACVRLATRTDPHDYIVPNVRGGRISRQRVAKIVPALRDLL